MNKISDVLLIIGAGAHVPYGFPSGVQLREDILSLEDSYFYELKSTYRSFQGEKKVLADKFHSIGKLIVNDESFFLEANKSSSNWKEVYITNQVKQFAKVFRESQNPSIDSYLSSFAGQEDILPEYSQHIKIGKAIIEGIIKYYLENVSVGKKYDWIQHIFKSHFETINDVRYAEKYSLNVITFNYDTYLEVCLKMYLQHNFFKATGLSIGPIINIKHVYGSVANPGEIKVIGEDRENQKKNISLELSQMIEKVKKIYFLGFGFDKYNLDILFSKVSKNCLSNLKMCSTNIGLNKFTVADIEKYIDNEYRIEFFEDHLNSIDSLALIRDHEPLLN